MMLIKNVFARKNKGEYMILGECNFCLTKYEKDTLTTALNSAKIDAERTLSQI